MKQERKIKKLYKSKSVIEGAGVHLKRAFGYSQVPAFDPFLMLDDFRSDNPKLYLKGFPWHPHRGIETITYVLDGHVEHGDSMGNKGDITSGDVQWMTAGSGIIHQEMPKGDNKGLMGGFQLWANLPAKKKMIEPKYRDVKSDQIPKVETDSGAVVRIICGQVGKVQGPVRDIAIEPEYLDITVPPHSSFQHPIKETHNAFAYIMKGKGYFCKERKPFTHEVEGMNYFDMQQNPYVGNETIVQFDSGDHIAVSTEEEEVRFLLVSGKPLNEPVAWYGPIVMNTQEELAVAFEEYQNGTFIRHPRSAF
jgi:quercetin 2,3-dioxygenase